ncbi:MAG TPA: hypothetical protein VL358_02820 [Caulobacteraceae bacterium]|nr:hypothetical protein [Caulobacteraceae bacterium]
MTTAAFAAPDFSGVWQVARPYSTGLTPVTVDGQPVPISPAGQAELDYLTARDKAGRPVIHNTMMGWPKGFIQASRNRKPFEIFQEPKQISFFFEEDHQYTFIHFDAKHPDHVKPSFLADSIAHWDGDTLVVDTIGFNGETPLNSIQLSAKAHTVMRLRLINGGKSLENIITIDDPVDFTRPWQMKILYDREPAGAHLAESVYAENNRNLPDLNDQ